MISASVTELELIGLCSISKRYYLMPQTYSKHRIFTANVLYQFNCRLYIRRVSRAVRQKHSVRAAFPYIISLRIPGKHSDTAIVIKEGSYYIFLHSKIYAGNMKFCISCLIFLYLFAAYP